MAKKNASVAKELKALAKEWKSAEPRGFGVPDGDYGMLITAMEVDLSKKGRLQVITSFKTVKGKVKDQECMKFDGIENEVSMGWFKGYAEVIGLEVPKKLVDLPDVITDFVEEQEDTVYSVTARTKDEYQNLFITGTLDEDEDEEEDDLEDDDDSDEDEDEDEYEEEDEEDEDDLDDEDDDLDLEDLDEDEDEEEDKPKSKKKKKASKKKTAKKKK